MAGVLMAIGASGLQAQLGDDAWNPFKQSDKPAPRRKALPPPVDQADLQREPRIDGRSRAVESSDLAPVAAPDNSGLPLNLWRGLDMAELERLLSTLDLPPRSPALHQIWRRMLLSAASPPGGSPTPDHFLALRIEALYRSGLLADMAQVLEGSGSASALAKVLLARRDVGLGNRDAGCRAIGALSASNSGLPGRLKGEAQLLIGLCAAMADDSATAGLAASMAREEGVTADIALRALDGFAAGAKVPLPLPARVSLIDYRFMQLMGPVPALQAVERGDAPLLVALADASASDVRVQIAAAEAALRLNALSPETVAQVYRRQADGPVRQHGPNDKGTDPVLRRAQLYRAIEATQNPALRAQLLQALLDDARRAGIRMQTARMLAPVLKGLWPSPESALLAGPAIEIALAAGEYDMAQQWAETAAGLQHWLALIEVAAPRSGANARSRLAYVNELAARGKLGADVLHRLATVLDALDIDVPRDIWEAAGRLPQPATGFLPETGVLADLAQSAKRKEMARTVLVAMRAFGGAGADGANILALGDVVRGLKGVGLEADARGVALEALLAVWPRMLGS